MTSLQCMRCGNWWTLHTLNPNPENITTRICPNCIPVALERMGDAPLGRIA